MTTRDITTFESAITRLKKLVFKQRVRLYEFLADFDKLRSGFVYPNHFLTALSIAGVDKILSYTEMQIICDTYTVPRSPSLIMTVRPSSCLQGDLSHHLYFLQIRNSYPWPCPCLQDYKTFLQDVNVVFTLPVSGDVGLSRNGCQSLAHP